MYFHISPYGHENIKYQVSGSYLFKTNPGSHLGFVFFFFYHRFNFGERVLVFFFFSFIDLTLENTSGTVLQGMLVRDGCVTILILRRSPSGLLPLN